MGVLTSGKKRKAIAALPDEMVEEILLRLPAKSLRRRFRCVSRSWRDKIDSPTFHDLHSRRAANHRKMFIRQAGHGRPFHADDGELILPCSLDLPQGQLFPITKSCHGLLLLRCFEYDTHYVWNPSTGETLALPDDRKSYRAAGYEWFNRCPSVSYGMGYCATTNRHKVVRMYHPDDGRRPARCEVFTLDESTYWRPAATEAPSACRVWCNPRQGAALCNGNLHFVGDDGVIVTFNVTDERFSTVMGPPEITTRDYLLTELDGCLCAYSSSYQVNPTTPYRIWLLRDYAVQGRWEEVCCIDWASIPEAESASFQSRWIAPLGMHRSSGSQEEKKIMLGTGSCKVLLVDGNNSSVVPKIIFSLQQQDDDECEDGEFPTMGMFEENLQSVGRMSEDILFSSPSSRVLSQVLSRLPARVVGRLNHVCKEWRALIKTDHFIDAHLSYHANLNKSPQVMFIDGWPRRFARAMERRDDLLPLPLVDDGSRVVCSKPCHGLNAGSFACYDFVCNPLTDYYKALPLGKGCTELRELLFRYAAAMSPLDYSGDAMFAGRFGLGYDEIVGKHVLVRLTYMERNVMMTPSYRLECQMRYVDDMFWEPLDPPPRPVANMPPAYADGKLYWMVDTELAQGLLPDRHEIIVLDVSTRRFMVLQGPPYDRHGCCSERVSVLELQGVVCVACSRHCTSTIQIWAMEDSAGSWFIKYNIELGRFSPDYSTELVTPLAVDAMDGRILLSTGRALGYYDPEKAELETIYRLGKHVQGKKFVPMLFQESLVNPCDRIF